MKRILYQSMIMAFSIATLASCDLTEEQRATAGRSMIFDTESGLEAYSYSFLLPLLYS